MGIHIHTPTDEELKEAGLPCLFLSKYTAPGGSRTLWITIGKDHTSVKKMSVQSGELAEESFTLPLEYGEVLFVEARQTDVNVRLPQGPVLDGETVTRIIFQPETGVVRETFRHMEDPRKFDRFFEIKPDGVVKKLMRKLKNKQNKDAEPDSSA